MPSSEAYNYITASIWSSCGGVYPIWRATGFMRDKPTPGFAVESRDEDRGNLRKKVERVDPAGCIGYNKFSLSRVCQLIGRLYHLIKATHPAHLLSVSRQLGLARVLNCRTPVENQEKSLSSKFTLDRDSYRRLNKGTRNYNCIIRVIVDY